MRISEYILIVAISFKISLKLSVRSFVDKPFFACVFLVLKNLSLCLIQVIVRRKFLF